MRTFLKIALLLAAVFLVAGSLLYFAKTRLEPPTPLEEGNLHEKRAWAYVESIEGLTNPTTLNKRFFAARQLVGFLGENQLVSTEVADQLTVGMAERYVLAYADHCVQRLASSDWDDQDIKEVAKQVAAVRDLKTADGKAAINKASRTTGRKFDDIEDMVCIYDSAIVLAKGGRYTGWQNAKKRMKRADRFARNPFLSHNHYLVERLDSFKMRVEKSHYNHLVDIVDELKAYTSKNKEEFDSIYGIFDRELAHYADSAAIVYGNRTENVTPLKLSAEQCKAWAWSYYSVYQPAKDAFDDVIDAGRSFIEEIVR